MLNALRRSANSFVIKLLLVLLAASFGVWGVGDYVNRQANAPVAVVNGYEIGLQEYGRLYDDQVNRMREAMGEQFNREMMELFGLKQQTLVRLINHHMLLHQTLEMGLTISPEHIRTVIGSNPAFRIDGQFNQDRYRQLLNAQRLNPRDFENQLASDLVLDQVQQTVRASLTAPAILVAETYARRGEERTITTLGLDPADLVGGVETTPEILKAFLLANGQRFLTPLEVKIQAVILDQDAVRDDVPISDEEIALFYEQHMGQNRVPETRQVRHILVKVDEESGLDEAAARTAIEQARARIEAGEPFEGVAQEVSQDISGRQGGALGTFPRGVMVPPFDEAAFSLEQGAVSEPVRTQFGFHLIRVDQINPVSVKPLEEVADQIRARLFLERADEAIYQRSIALEDQLFSGAELSSIAADLNLRYVETDFVSRENPGTEGDLANPKLLDAAFSTPAGETSSVIEFAESRFVALRVVERREPRPRTFEEAGEAVAQAYRNEQARLQAKTAMDALLKAIVEGEREWGVDPAADLPIKAGQAGPFTTEAPAPAPAIRRAAFQLQMETPIYPLVLQDGEVFTLIRLLGIRHADAEALAGEVHDGLQARLESELGDELMAGFLAALRQEADIEINLPMLDRF